jgi:trehalose 6-phosphate phosphatase
MDTADELALPALLADTPRSGLAVLLDIDGVLAPIVDDPATVAVPDATLRELERLRDEVAVLAVVTGRTLEHARRLVPLDGIWTAAVHGMHILSPDGTEDVDPTPLTARPQLDLAVRLAQTVGWRYEDKGHSVTMHFRHASSPEQTARGMQAHMSTVLDRRVVGVHHARMALEVRPIGGRTKADAVTTVVGASTGVQAAVYVGDDFTDVDAFRGIEALDVPGVRVAVASAEAPPELLELADLVLHGQPDVQRLLQAL